MKIINIIGGLGNQMFQYAFALSLKEKYPQEDVLIDTSHFHYLFTNKYKGTNLHNGYEIDKVFPNAKLKKATALQLMRVTWYMPNYLLSRVLRRYLPVRKTEYVQERKDIFAYKPEPMNVEGNCYYEGNWESVHYYIDARNRIQQDFAHGEPNATNAAYIRAMEKEESIGMHIRRGDYLQSKKYSNICDLDYYARGISKLLEDGKSHTFYIFSNDIKWCEENIVPLCGESKVVMVRENTGKMSCWDMFLMSHCKDLIIANSSFSWWGAFLNARGGRVIAPKKWINEDREFDIWLDEWIRL